MSDKKNARGLGWASIGIGLTEIAAPKTVERVMGLGNGQTTGILRALGIREIMHGVDILSHPDPTSGVWARRRGCSGWRPLGGRRHQDTPTGRFCHGRRHGAWDRRDRHAVCQAIDGLIAMGMPAHIAFLNSSC